MIETLQISCSMGISYSCLHRSCKIRRFGHSPAHPTKYQIVCPKVHTVTQTYTESLTKEETHSSIHRVSLCKSLHIGKFGQSPAHPTKYQIVSQSTHSHSSIHRVTQYTENRSLKKRLTPAYVESHSVKACI